MRKKELKQIKELHPTKGMYELAIKDKPTKIGTYYVTKKYISDKYIRCVVEGNVLKVAIFHVEDLKKHTSMPMYVLYMDKAKNDFITYDTVAGKWRNAMIDSLEWPSGVASSNTLTASLKEERIVQRYFSSDKAVMECVRNFQYSVRALQLKERHEKETAPWDEALKRTPELPDYWKQKADSLMKQQYIFYDYNRKGAKTGYCTSCKKEVPVDRPKHNKYGTCKCCGRKIQYKAKGKAGRIITEQEFIYLVQECEDEFLLRRFLCSRVYSPGEYERPKLYVDEIRRVFYDKKATPVDAYYWSLYKNQHLRWIKDTTDCRYNRPYISYHLTSYKGPVYMDRTADIPALSYTGMAELCKSGVEFNPEIYLEAVDSYPAMEKIAKAGLGNLAMSILSNSEKKHLLTVETTELTKLLGIDKMRLSRLKVNNGTVCYLTWLQYEKEKNTIFADDMIGYFENNGLYPNHLNTFFTYMSLTKTYNYIRKQMEIGKFNRIHDLIRTYEDYVKMALRVKIELKKDIFNHPKDLREAHDEVVKLCISKEDALRAGEIIEKFPDVDTICQSIKEKYEFGNEDFTILVPNKVEDIIREGKILRHCVGSHDYYFERIQNRETYIMFLRRTSELDKPYYTLEVEPNGTIRQKRTTGDTQNKDIEDANKFFRIWQKEIQKRLSEEDIKLSKKSKFLREKEFEDLRKNKTTIRNGVLAGKLLADVLEEDLLELEEEINKTA